MHAGYIHIETMAKERQRQLLKEAELDRLARHAGPSHRGIAKGAIIGLANLLISAGHWIKVHCDSERIKAENRDRSFDKCTVFPYDAPAKKLK